MTTGDLQTLESFLDRLLQNKPLEPLESPGELAGVQDRLLRLSSFLQELTEFSLKLSSGDVDATPPPRANYLASSLKQLQAQMLHLTWQAKCVAEGDYLQKVDFMGEFSDAFNQMVDQLRNREANLAEQRDVMERIFNLIEPILVINAQNPAEILYLNEMAAVRFGTHVGLNVRYSESLSRILALPPSTIERQILDTDSERWYGVTVRTLKWDAQNQAKLFYCRDITSHKQRENNLSAVANTDELTGIYNRRAFDQTFGKLWYTSMSARKPISILVFDLDRFKELNDTYGHLCGDKMLAQFARILTKYIGRGDDIIARYGGDEFIAALPFTTEDNAIRIAKSIGEMTSGYPLSVTDDHGEDLEVHISVSIGVSTLVPDHTTQPSQLIQAADTALRQAKAAGRNRVSFLTVADLPQNP